MVTTALQKKEPDYLDFPKLQKQFLKDLDIKKSSVETYRRSLSRFLRTLDISNPTRDDILAYKRLLIKEGLSPYTVSTYIVVVRQFFAWLESKTIYPNIAKSIKGVRVSSEPQKSALSAVQSLELMDSVDISTVRGKRDFAMINLLIRTGTRVGEISRADIKDIGEKQGRTVLYVWRKGHNSKDSYVIVEGEALETIRGYLKTRQPQNQEEPLFVSCANNSFSKRLPPNTVSIIIKSRLKAIGLLGDRFSAHSLRHTGASLAAEAGAPVMAIQEMLGHSNINTSMRYIHNRKRLSDPAEGYIAKILTREVA